MAELARVIYSDDKNGAVMPKLLMYPQKNLIDSIGAFFLTSGFLYHFGREKDHRQPIYNQPMEIFSAKGACILFKKEVLEKTGLFDKDYFAYFEETDLCQRIWLAGYKVVYTPQAVVYHKGGGASGQMISSYIQFHSFKNRLCTFIKNLSFTNLLKTLPLTLFIYQCASILYLLTGKFGNAWAIQKAIFWNLIHLKETFKKRKFVQNQIRTVTDEFLPKVTRPVRLSYYYYLFRGLKYYRD